MIRSYSGIAPRGDLILIQRLCERLKGRTFLHVNSTKMGGGVAEILGRMVPILKGLGIEARWEIIEGDVRFFEVTKRMHNGLQGRDEGITEAQWEYYYEINRSNAKRLNLSADMVLIHDPQPLPLVEFRDSSKWVWRCHIDLSRPSLEIFDRIRPYCERYDALIFSVAKFAMNMPVDEFIIPPSIDPLSEKNMDLPEREVKETLERFKIPDDRPIVLQVSRFDRFKDPTGVIRAYRMVKRYNDCVLVLAGSPATDDPEGEFVLEEVMEYAADDPDINILMLPPGSDRAINALQRAATVVLQKSLKEGFGLTVSEAMWKQRPVIGGAVGGIPLQIVHGVTGFLVYSDEGCAFRIRQLLNDPEMAKRMGERGRDYVKTNFLITRQIRDYLSIWYALENQGGSVIEVGYA